MLATQVEQAAIDRQALAPSLGARDGAAAAAKTVDQQTLQQLHDLLTPAQRGQLADAVEAGMSGHGRHGAGGDAGAGFGRLARMGQHLGLTSDQEQQIAANLRAERQAGKQGDAAGSGAPHGQGQRGRGAWIESFRSDSLNASAGGQAPQAASPSAGMRTLENLMQAMVPVLTPVQRAQLADHLRKRAAHETRS